LRTRPPFLARLLLVVFLRGASLETILGDIDEGYARRHAQHGEIQARWWYWRQVIASLWALGVDVISPRSRDRSTRAPTRRVRAADWAQDLKQAARRLLRSPGFTSAVVLTLALGVGAATAVFTIVDAILVDPLPFDEPDRLVAIWHEAPGLDLGEIRSAAALQFAYRDRNRVFEDVAHWSGREVAVTGAADPEQVMAVRMTAGLLPLLGVEPRLGRRFTERDDAPGAPLTVLLAEGYWQRRFAGEPTLLGRTIVVDGQVREVIGVLPSRFSLPGVEPQLYLPMQLDRATTVLADFNLSGVGRLLPSVSLAEANDDLGRILPIAPQLFPGAMTTANVEAARLGPAVHPLKQDYVGDLGQVLWVLLGSVSILLFVAFANVANLVLVRTEARRREMAVRASMGAGRGRIVRHLLAESALLATTGTALGLLVAAGGLRAFLQTGLITLPRADEISMDGTVLGFAAAIALTVTILCGIVSSRGLGRGDIGRLLRSVTGPAAGSWRWAKNGLVVAQIALALVLLVGSGLMIRSFTALRRVEPGFTAPESVLTMRVAIPAAEISDPAGVAAAFEDIWNRLRAIPGVSAVGASSALTMDGPRRFDFIWSEDRPLSLEVAPPSRTVKWVSEGYFEAMGNPVIVGRPIMWSDVHDLARVAVVTRNFAEEYWGSPEAALGKRIAVGKTTGPVWKVIVGVVGDVRDDGPAQPATTVVFWPYVYELGGPPIVPRTLSFAVRAEERSAASLTSDVKAAVWAVDPDLPLANLRTLDALVSKSMARTSVTMLMLVVSAVTALVLGLVGLYGVVSCVVARRTHEIGIRMALGAERNDVTSMVLRGGLSICALGVGIGLVGAVTLTRLMASLLYGVEATDPLTYSAVAVALTVAALVATYLPARRAAGVDPLISLKQEG